jgi:hypothetical protein
MRADWPPRPRNDARWKLSQNRSLPCRPATRPGPVSLRGWKPHLPGCKSTHRLVPCTSSLTLAMSDQTDIIPSRNIAPLIRSIRDARVILDTDLAKIYGVETRALNQALKRNQARFPDDFVFELTREEIIGISQAVISLQKLKFSKQVRAFTEHGALMAASILNSPRAVAMSVYVIRAFIKMREDLAANAAILKCVAEIDKTFLLHDGALRDIYQKLRPLLEPPPTPPKPGIGFHVKEDSVPYRVKRKGTGRREQRGLPAGSLS